MLHVMEPEDAPAFWDGRYAQGLVYGTEPTSIAHQLADVFRRERVATILEAGCGSGRDALFYARSGFVVTGLDLSQNALRWVKEQAAREGLELALRVGDLLAVDLPPGSFDATVAIHLIHLVPEPVRRAMVNRLWYLTRDGGLVATANYSTEEAGFTAWAPYLESNTRVDPKGKLVHFFDAQDVAALFPPNRFDLLACEVLDLRETPDSGPATHREWLTIARKIRAC